MTSEILSQPQTDEFFGLKRVDVLGIGLSVLNMPTLLSVLRKAIDSRTKVRVAFCNVHTLTECLTDGGLNDTIQGCQVVSPDGMPVVWLGRRAGAHGIERVCGPDALLACCEDGLQRGYRHYFFGSTDETLAALTERLQARYPGMVVAGTYSPPFRDLTPAEDDDVVARINAAKPDIVWVGLGMPKQEFWAAEHQARIDAPVILPVGAAFAFHAGTVKQAPLWMRKRGLEWLYRLLQEPTRLWKRYFVSNTRFIYEVAKRELSLARKRPPAPR